MNILRDLFALHNIGLDEITPSFQSFSDGFSQLTDGNVHVSFALAGFPTSALVQAGASNEMSLFELIEDKMA